MNAPIDTALRTKAQTTDRRSARSRLLTSRSSLAYPPNGVYAGGAVSPRSMGVLNAFLYSPRSPRGYRRGSERLVEPSDSPLSTASNHPPRGGSGQELGDEPTDSKRRVIFTRRFIFPLSTAETARLWTESG